VIAPALRARRGRCFATSGAVGLVILAASAPASAEVGATASIFSEARHRGVSLSAGHPVGEIALSYDDPEGFYGSLAGTVVVSSEYGLRPLGLLESIGYAKRLRNGPTIDVGVLNANYSRYTGYDRSSGYSELYAGLVGKVFSSHIYLSPNYFRSHSWTAYGEVEAGIQPTRKVRLTAHVGSLVPLGSAYSSRVQYDWQIGATREIGPLSLHLAFSDGGPGRDFYGERLHRRRALVAGATMLFEASIRTFSPVGT
jgi:uncharacterized protein (TIGR02001 family)